MTIRTEFIEKHPNFPLLEAENTQQIEDFFRERHWLESGERVQSCAKAGEGNMNLTLRVRTNRRSVIVKQARPWVEKYDHIPAPWDRMRFEQQFYERAAAIPPVAGRMPALLDADEQAHALLLEDAGQGGDFTDLYAASQIPQSVLTDLGDYLSALHHHTHGEPDPTFGNHDMRKLNHQHIFQVPLDPDNGLDLDSFETGLKGAALFLQEDNDYRGLVEETGQHYLADGPCLLQGDFFPGSWLRTKSGVKIIDFEFCFFGHPEFDLGVPIAHFALANQPRDIAETFLAAYGHPGDGSLCAEEWIGRYAAAEVMRRLIGVAQLPIGRTENFRRDLLQRSRIAMMTGDWKELF